MSRAEDIFEKLIYFGEDALDEFIRERQTEETLADPVGGYRRGPAGCL